MEDDITPNKRLLSTPESLITGLLAGAGEVIFNYPLYSTKIRMQSGLPITLSPILLYKGFLTELCGTITMTTFQVGFSAKSHHKVQQSTDKLNYTLVRIATSSFGGAVSAVFMSPFDLLLTQQIKHKHNSVFTTWKYITGNFGYKTLFRGLWATALADATLTGAYYGSFPLLKRKLKYDYGVSNTLSTLIAGTSIGVFAATLSQPADTVKTIQQKYADSRYPKTFFSCVTDLRKKKNNVGFYTGLGARSLWFSSSILVAGHITDMCESYFNANPL